MKRETEAELAILVVVVVWGANFAFIKAAVLEIPPLAFAALRFTVASILLAALVVHREGSVRWPPGTGWRVVALGLIGNTAYQAFFMMGIARTTAGNSALMVAPTPALIAIIAALTGVERLTRPVVLGIALTFVGVAMVVGQSASGPSAATLSGDLLVLAGGVCWAVYTVGVRAAALPISSLRLTALAMLTGTPVLVLLGSREAATFDWSGVSALAWGGTAYATFLGLCTAYVMFNFAVKVLGGPRTGVFLSLIPVVALFVAALLVAERPTVLQLTGTVFIIAGLLAARSRRGGDSRGAAGPTVDGMAGTR
jgi:drug/metabolite transporter (DMT)-like permease